MRNVLKLLAVITVLVMGVLVFSSQTGASEHECQHQFVKETRERSRADTDAEWSEWSAWTLWNGGTTLRWEDPGFTEEGDHDGNPDDDATTFDRDYRYVPTGETENCDEETPTTETSTTSIPTSTTAESSTSTSVTTVAPTTSESPSMSSTTISSTTPEQPSSSSSSIAVLASMTTDPCNAPPGIESDAGCILPATGAATWILAWFAASFVFVGLLALAGAARRHQSTE